MYMALARGVLWFGSVEGLLKRYTHTHTGCDDDDDVNDVDG